MQIMKPAEQESTMKENQNGILSGHGTKVDPLSTEVKDKDGYWHNQELEYSVVVDDFTNGNEKGNKDSAAASKVHTELSQTDSDLYTDNHFMECDLPELIVCYKDSTCHAVKDICVDEGITTENKLLTESTVDGHCSPTSNGYKHTDMTKEIVNMDFLFQDGLRSLSCKDCNKDAANDCASKGEVNIDLLIPYGQNSSSKDDVHHDGAYDCGAVGLKSSSESEKDQDSASFCGSGNLIQSGEEKCNAAEKSMESVSNSMLLVKEFREETSLKFLLESSKCVDNDVQQSNQISCAQVISQGPGVSKTEESNKSSDVDNLIYNSEVETGIITFNFDSFKLAESTREENPENVIEQQLKSENKPIHDDGIFNNHLVVTSQVKRGDGGESSFSVGGPLSDVVTYSGPIPFSGSISLRSDSSTTSTRSFAFPVLPNEWNSSPIRMAKADRRHFRKHRGWRLGLLCYDIQGSDAATFSNVRQDLSEWKQKHATLVLTTVKEISRLRYELCPRHMKDRRFWQIYFTLVNSHVAPSEKNYVEKIKLKEAENIKDGKLEQTPTVGSEGKLTSLKSKTSSSSAEKDLDTFLLGDLEDSDVEPADDDDENFDDDFDKIDNLDVEDET